MSIPPTLPPPEKEGKSVKSLRDPHQALQKCSQNVNFLLARANSRSFSSINTLQEPAGCFRGLATAFGDPRSEFSYDNRKEVSGGFSECNT